MATNTPSRLNFLTLPAEIRAKVYRETFAGNFILISNQATAEAGSDRRCGNSNTAGPLPKKITRILALLRERDFKKLYRSTLIDTKTACPTDPLALTQTCRHINQEAAPYIAETITLVFGFPKRTTRVEPLDGEGAIQLYHAPCRIPSTYLKHVQYVTLNYPMIRSIHDENQRVDFMALPPGLAVHDFSSLKILHLLCRTIWFWRDNLAGYEKLNRDSEEGDAELVAAAKEDFKHLDYTRARGWTGTERVGPMAKHKDRRFQILLEKSFLFTYPYSPNKQLTWVVDWDSEKVVSKVWRDNDPWFGY